MTLYTSSGSKNCLIEKTLNKVNFDRENLTRKDISREQAAFKECAKARTATGMDGTLPKCNFENLKPVEISKNSFGII